VRHESTFDQRESTILAITQYRFSKGQQVVNRPPSVTVVACVLFAFGVLGCVGTAFAIVSGGEAGREAIAERPVPLPVQFAWSVTGTIVDLVCAYYLLRGRNWSRYLYVGWTVISLIAAFLTAPIKILIIPGVAIFCAITFVLFRPAANAFFVGGGASIDPRSIPSTRRVVSIVFYVLAGFFFATAGVGALMPFEAGIAKTMMVCFQMLPFAVCLLIGRSLSPGPVWKRDVGIVFTVGAAAGALMAVMLSIMFASPEFQKSIPTQHQDFSSDYLFAIIWFVAWGLLGVALLLLSRKPARGAWNDQTIPRLVDR
jgi:hypothetical protein